MKWLLLAFQLMNSHRSLMQTRALVERAKDAAEKSKKMAFFSFTTLLFLIYFITSTIVFALEIGRMIEAGQGIYWSGLMWTGAALLLFGVVLLIIGTVVLKFPVDEEEKKPVTQPKDLRTVIDQLAVTFVTQLVKSLSEKVETKLAPRPETTQAQKQQTEQTSE